MQLFSEENYGLKPGYRTEIKKPDREPLVFTGQTLELTITPDKRAGTLVIIDAKSWQEKLLPESCLATFAQSFELAEAAT